MIRPIWPAGALSILLILAGCGSGADDRPDTGNTAATTAVEPTTTAASSPAADPAFAQLCGVLASAHRGDLEEVRKSFDHGPLHTLAEAAIDVDRAVAARLLGAKEAVESGLTDPAITADRIAEDLDELADAAADAHAIIGTPQPPCEEL